MPSTKSVRLDPVQTFKVKKPSTVVISLSSQSSSDICRISWFSVDAIRCHRCLPSSREQQAEDAEHCAYRLRCMMSQLRSARVDKTSPPSKHDLLRGVVMMAHITAPPSQWQRSNSKKTDASWEDEAENSHEINDTAFDGRTPAPENRRVLCS